MIARSTTPIVRTAIKRRSRKKKPGHNPLFLAWLHTLPCFVCHREIFEHFSATELLEIFTAAPPTLPVEAAHIGRSTSRRGLGQKYPDKEAAPMCSGHHRTCDRSLHAMGPQFWTWYGIDRDGIVDKLQEMFEVSKR